MKITTFFHTIITGLIFLLGLLTIEISPELGRGYSGYGIPVRRNTDPALVFPSSTPGTVAGKTNVPKTGPIENIKEAEKEYQSLAFTYSLGDAMLIGEEGSMAREARLTIGGLFREELPALNAGMVNVTGEYGAYRMLPHGMVFEKDIDIILPYDTALLPMGFTPHDIMTYYYDEQYGRWIEIYRDSVDVAGHRIYSKVNHFTDFINAVIRTPEMPETQGYVPTQMSDIKVADPLSGMTLVQAPQANNNGTANMEYPIEIPAGRQGMQPSLAVMYNSSGGNGWLGVGWDIAVPSITVETRWGVPRYDSSKESEAYLLEGEQLVTMTGGKHDPMPHRTNQWANRKNGNIRFYPRKDEAFDSIVRHGNGPSEYWWSVTGRNGVTHFYGKAKGRDALDTGSVLRDEEGNIARWALTESRDPHGNTVLYDYDLVFHSGISGSAVKGRQLYLRNINYTGHEGSRGKYNIRFTRRDTPRRDVTTSGRYGLKEVTAHLLCNVSVYYSNQHIRTYAFLMENSKGSLYKTRLADIFKVDAIVGTGVGHTIPEGGIDHACLPDDVSSFEDMPYKNYTRTHFDYYDRPGAEELFDRLVTHGNLPDEQISSHFLTGAFNSQGHGKSTALGASKGKSWSLGGTASLGVGANVCMTTISVGGNFDYSPSGSEGMLTMIDLDGDGLADKVFKKNGKIYFRKQISSAERPFDFGRAWELRGLENFLLESTETTGWGLQASAGVSLSGGWPAANTKTSVYFADVNADGLPDLITERGVFFNTLDDNGVPSFIPFSTFRGDPADPSQPDMVITSATAPCGGIIFDGEVSDSLGCTVELKWYETFTIDPNWEEAERIGSRFDPATYHWTVTEGEGVMFVHIYEKYIYCDQRKVDPDLDAVRVWVAPYGGRIKIESAFALLEDSGPVRQQSKFADGVRYSIQWDSGIHPGARHLVSGQARELTGKVIDKDDYGTHHWTGEINIKEGDILFFRLQSNKNRSFDKVNWVQEITYTDMAEAKDDYGKDRRVYHSGKDFVVTGNTFFQAATDGKVSINGTIKTGELYRGANLVIMHNQGIRKIIPIQENREAGFHDQFEVSQYDSVKFIIIGSGGDNTTWSNIECSPHIEFTGSFTSSNGGTMNSVLDYYPPAQMRMKNDFFRINTVPHQNIWGFIQQSIQRYYISSLFGPMYRGWGQFAYNNNYPGAQATDLIDITQLKLDPLVAPTSPADADTNNIYADPDCGDYSREEVTAGFQAEGMYYPLASDTRWVEMQPNSRYQAWVGYGNINYITRDRMTNTRMPELVAVEEMSDLYIYDHPVPNPTPENPVVKTIRKESESRPKNFSRGLGIPMITLGKSDSWGSNKVLTDYMDLNGDRYPDFLGDAMVQYTMPWGGIGPERPLPGQVWQVMESALESEGKTYGASYPMPRRQPSGNPKGAKVSVDGQGEVSASLGKSIDKTQYIWMDINGDGLPDKVSKTNGVSMNLGYRFTPYEKWNLGEIKKGSSQSNGLSIGASGSFNQAQASIGGGLSVNRSENAIEEILMDFNGDGLPDKVKKQSGRISVSYNLGSGQWSPAETIPLATLGASASYSESANAAVTVGFTFLGILKFNIGIQTSPYNRTFNKDIVQWIDINGDGYVDYVVSNEEGKIGVCYNRTGKANLLKKATNFTGSSIEIDYEMPLACYDQPQRGWVMSSVKTEDPATPCGGELTLKEFSYGKPNYNRYERMNYGYDTVVSREYELAGAAKMLYRYTVEGYHNRSFLKRGKMINRTLFDGYANPYIETLYDVVLVDRSSGEVIGEDDCPAEAFPVLESEIVNYYEGYDKPRITTARSFRYDRRRNVTEYINYGDTVFRGDDFRAEITYQQGMAHNLIALPVLIRVKDIYGSVMRQRSAKYDSRGNMVLLKQDDPGWGSPSLLTEFTYDIYGNRSRKTLGANHKGQRMFYDYVYDAAVNTYPAIVSDALGHTSRTDYDLRWGVPLETIDINGNRISYQYTPTGLLEKVTSPYEQNTVRSTIFFEYYPANYASLDIHTGSLSSAITRHYDVQHDEGSGTNEMMTTLLSDGFGRPVQTKKDAEIGGREVSAVSGKVLYDGFGRKVKEYHPFTEPLGTAAAYNPYYDPQTETHTAYDILDRPLGITFPDGSSTHYHYDFGSDYSGDVRFMHSTTDAEGNEVTAYLDYRGIQTTIKAPGDITTVFYYYPLGEVAEVIDPDGMSTQYDFDQLGRCIAKYRTADSWGEYFYYDGAGNLTSRATQNHQSARTQIEYHYDYNRLQEIRYPFYPENNVLYRYGDPGDATDVALNRVGRVKYQQDITGWQEFDYGPLGEITKNTRIFVTPVNNKGFRFETRYRYDSWNRIQQITYPDGEQVYYQYNLGGQLNSMYSDDMAYIMQTEYDEMGRKRMIRYGNGTESHYSYDRMQRLVLLNSMTSTREVMQNLSYVYDQVGNITSLYNMASTLYNGMGGQYTKDYQYDNLYRLSFMQGSFGSLTSSLEMAYSANGRILQKTLHADMPGTSPKQYTNGYEYQGSSNLLKELNKGEKTFRWDYNGNLSRINHNISKQPFERWFCWDDENRLSAVSDPNYRSNYFYDATGERAIKVVGKVEYMNVNGRWYSNSILDNAVLYTSPYMVATPQGYTKHYYAGDNRIASRIGEGRFSKCIVTQGVSPFLERQIKKTLKDESKSYFKYPKYTGIKDPPQMAELPFDYLGSPVTAPPPYHGTSCYWYHTDHLGSSSWITDEQGQAVQYLDYLPFGEPWINQRSTGWNARYTFSGKERDQETGYSYFGARYYDSDLSLWLSVDPLADKYPYQSPYVYCGNNPLNIIDPFGLDEWEINKKGYITHVEGSEGKPDRMFAIDNKGNRITDRKGNEKSVNVDKDIMNSLISGTKAYSDQSVEYSSMNTTGKDDIAKDMFKFMSRNTDVEWSYWGGTKDSENFSTLSTSHRATEDVYSAREAFSLIRHNGLSFFFHSHPRNENQGMYSNPTDRSFKGLIQKNGSPGAIFGVMHRGVLYDLDKPFRINWDGTHK